MHAIDPFLFFDKEWGITMYSKQHTLIFMTIIATQVVDDFREPDIQDRQDPCVVPLHFMPIAWASQYSLSVMKGM